MRQPDTSADPGRHAQGSSQTDYLLEVAGGKESWHSAVAVFGAAGRQDDLGQRRIRLRSKSVEHILYAPYWCAQHARPKGRETHGADVMQVAVAPRLVLLVDVQIVGHAALLGLRETWVDIGRVLGSGIKKLSTRQHSTAIMQLGAHALQRAIPPGSTDSPV